MKALLTWPKLWRRASASWIETGKTILSTSAGDLGQVDDDRFVVALTLAGEVVPRVFDGPLGAFQIVVEDEVRVPQDPAVAAQQRAGVEVEIGPRGRARVPTETDQDPGEVRCGLGEGDVAPLASVTPMLWSSPDDVVIAARPRGGPVVHPGR